MCHSPEALDLRLKIKTVEIEIDTYTLNPREYAAIELKLLKEPIRYTYLRFESSSQTVLSGE